MNNQNRPLSVLSRLAFILAVVAVIFTVWSQTSSDWSTYTPIITLPGSLLYLILCFILMRLARSSKDRSVWALPFFLLLLAPIMFFISIL